MSVIERCISCGERIRSWHFCSRRLQIHCRRFAFLAEQVMQQAHRDVVMPGDRFERQFRVGQMLLNPGLDQAQPRLPMRVAIRVRTRVAVQRQRHDVEQLGAQPGLVGMRDGAAFRRQVDA